MEGEEIEQSLVVVAPVHTRDMQKALEKAGVKVEALYVPSEGHGFFAEAHTL